MFDASLDGGRTSEKWPKRATSHLSMRLTAMRVTVNEVSSHVKC